MISPRTLFIGLLVIALASIVVSISVGSVPMDWRSLWSVAHNDGTILERTLVLELRLPRSAAAFAVGGLLALAGALMQVLLRNPLADPYVLGISGGAAVAALAAMLLGLSGFSLTATAFGGALLSMVLVFTLARGTGNWNPTRLLLTGVVVASGWAALIGFILSVSPDTGLKNMLFWLMGDLSFAGNAIPALTMLAIGLIVSLAVARDLNVMARGEMQARTLGVATSALSLIIYVLASLLTASAVTLAGSIGFVGLIAPHLIRLLGATDHRSLLPCAVLLGGSLVVNADTLARSILAPQQLPAGIVTALLGVPVFLFLLNRHSR
jgi:iron complex transport system permease protein